MIMTRRLTVSLDGGPQLPVDDWEYRPPPVVYAQDPAATKPDLAWVEVDGHGHEHRWARTDPRSLPTLTPTVEYVPCDCCDGYEITIWHCAICGDPVDPGYVPDWQARNPGIPITTGPAEMTLMVADFPTDSYDNRADHEVIIRGLDRELTGRGIFTQWERSSSHGLRGQMTVWLTN